MNKILSCYLRCDCNILSGMIYYKKSLDDGILLNKTYRSKFNSIDEIYLFKDCLLKVIRNRTQITYMYKFYI